MGEWKYKKPVCRGAFALGTACGNCERCEEERAKYLSSHLPTTDKHGNVIAEPHSLPKEGAQSTSPREAAIKEVVEALEEIIRREDKAWKPMKGTRSDDEEALDDTKHEVWMEAAEIARAALSTYRKAEEGE